MSGSSLSEAGIFLISTIFDLYILAVALRFLLQCVRADFYNPISQLLVTITNPVLRPMRRWIPAAGGIDLSSLLLMFVLKSIELMLIWLISTGRIPALPGLFVVSIAKLLNLMIYIFFYAILIQVIISWVNPGAYNPATVLLYRLTDPLMRPARRLVPPVGGLDLSPMVVLVALQLIIILFIKPLIHLGSSLTGFVL